MRSTKNSSLSLVLASSADDKTVVDIDAIMDNFTVVIYAITILLGLTGNGMVIWVAGFKVRPKVTNVWLVNLAVADFIFCLSRILSLVKKLFFDYWPFGLFFCKFNGFFKYTNMFCSVFLLAVISLDRAMCVWWPVFTNNRRTVSAARFISVGVWVAASGLSSPYFVYRQVYLGKNNLSKCSLEVKEAADGDNTTKNWLYSIRFLCGFLLPFLVILCCYALVGFGLRRKRFTGKTRTLRILASLVCAFFLCWGPYHCLLLAKMMNSKSDAVKIGLPIAKGFAYFNSCVNPLLYFCMGLDMRSRGRARQSLTGVYRRALTEDEDRRSSQSNADNSVSGTHPLSKRHRGEKDSVGTPGI